MFNDERAFFIYPIGTGFGGMANKPANGRLSLYEEKKGADLRSPVSIGCGLTKPDGVCEEEVFVFQVFRPFRLTEGFTNTLERTQNYVTVSCHSGSRCKVKINI